MKKPIVLFILMMLFLPLIPRTAHAEPVQIAGSYCSLNAVTIVMNADCNKYGWSAKIDTTFCTVLRTSGLGTWPWNDKTQAGGHEIVIVWAADSNGPSGETYREDAPMIYKSDWCDPITGKKLKGPASGSRSVSLPPQQPYLLLAEERLWCYTLTKTPILGDAKEAWCQFGTAPEGINDFCLQSNYQDLFGCTLENYTVHYPSREQLIRYYCG